MQKHLLLILVVGLVSLGCTDLIKRECISTMECSADQVCKDGYCFTCRGENQTCDVNDDCCGEMVCAGGMCARRSCPSDCSDSDPCTTDKCDYSTGFSCVNEPVFPCCGNGICEIVENCGTCADCGCPANETCSGGSCVDAFGYEMGRLPQEYNATKCYDEIISAWKSGQYTKAKEGIPGCRERISSLKSDIEALGSRLSLDSEKGAKAEVAAYKLSARDQVLAYAAKEILVEEKSASGEEYDKVGYVDDQKSARLELEWALYWLYEIKEEHPELWDSESQGLLDYSKTAYENVNLLVNSFYDEICESECKYVLQVDPANPQVAKVTDELKAGISDDDLVLATLHTYVRNNTNYSFDPAIQTDWVQPPGYTLITGYGDCDDKSVLLASMFLRAGIDGVEMCSVDMDGDSEWDHETVGVYREHSRRFYDPTLENATEPIPDWLYEGRWTCYNVVEFQEYWLEPKCYDGTSYGECDVEGIYYCNDEGILISDCERCGCNRQWPNCITEGPDRGYCFSCDYGWTKYPDGTCCRPGWKRMDYHSCCPEDSRYVDEEGYCH